MSFITDDDRNAYAALKKKADENPDFDPRYGGEWFTEARKEWERIIPTIPNGIIMNAKCIRREQPSVQIVKHSVSFESKYAAAMQSDFMLRRHGFYLKLIVEELNRGLGMKFGKDYTFRGRPQAWGSVDEYDPERGNGSLSVHIEFTPPLT